MKAFFKSLAYHKENILPAVAMLLIMLAIYAVNWLTGRPVLDDPGEIVGFLFMLLEWTMIFMAVGWFQEHFFGYRSKQSTDQGGAPVPLADDIYDAAVTIILVILSMWFVKH